MTGPGTGQVAAQNPSGPPRRAADPGEDALPDGARLRPMGRHDLGAVARAEARLFGAEAWSPALLRTGLAAASGPGADRCYVVVERAAEGGSARPGAGRMDDAGDAGGAGGGELLGYAGLWFGDGAGDADLLTVATLPSARRRGIATVMIAHLLRRARQAGCAAVLLEVRVSNAGAQALYRRLGFAPVGRRRRYYLAPVEDALVMRADTGARHGAGPVGRAGSVGAVGAEAVEAGSGAVGAEAVEAGSGAAGRADRAVVAGRPPHLSD